MAWGGRGGGGTSSKAVCRATEPEGAGGRAGELIINSLWRCGSRHAIVVLFLRLLSVTTPPPPPARRRPPPAPPTKQKKKGSRAPGRHAPAAPAPPAPPPSETSVHVLLVAAAGAAAAAAAAQAQHRHRAGHHHARTTSESSGGTPPPRASGLPLCRRASPPQLRAEGPLLLLRLCSSPTAMMPSISPPGKVCIRRTMNVAKPGGPPDNNQQQTPMMDGGRTGAWLSSADDPWHRPGEDQPLRCLRSETDGFLPLPACACDAACGAASPCCSRSLPPRSLLLLLRRCGERPARPRCAISGCAGEALPLRCCGCCVLL